MVNLSTKRIVISCHIMWLNKTYREYVSRKVNTNADTHILQDEYESYKRYHVKIDTDKNEVKTENVKLKKLLGLKRIIWGNSTYIRLSRSFILQSHKIK